MYVELGGQRYALDSVLTQGGLALLFADTPVEDVDALACALPDVLRIYAAGSGALLYEFQGFTRWSCARTLRAARCCCACGGMDSQTGHSGRKGTEIEHP